MTGSAAAADLLTAAPRRAVRATVALLGVGQVGTAFLHRLQASELPVDVAYLSNSRQRTSTRGAPPLLGLQRLAASRVPADLGTVGPSFATGDAGRIVVDATASPAVAERHRDWLRRGIHVVTASKIANGGTQGNADALVAAARSGGVTYGDSATVGAGLPVLRAIRDLRAGGDIVHRIMGVLSGSVAWILDEYAARGGATSLTALVREAHEKGLTEPDPVVDLGGTDVLRKLLVLARAAGASLEPADVKVDPLGPAGSAPVGADADRWFAQLFTSAAVRGWRLSYLASWSARAAPTVGLVELDGDHPLAPGAGCDNRVAIWSSRYADQPLIIQGPGAGAEVTAAALLDDVVRAAASHRAR